MANEIQCPVFLAAADTDPLISPITRAGQHHAPMRAGIDSAKVSMETHSVLPLSGVLSSPPSSDSSRSFVFFDDSS